MEQYFPFSPILLGFLLFLFALLRLWKKPKGYSLSSNLNPPPGPWKLPIIGNIHQLVGSLPHHALRDLAKKYGPVMQLQIGEVPTVVVTSAEVAKEVLKTQELNFAERPSFLAADIMFYNRKDIALAPYGDYWRQMRKVCILELFSAKRVKSFRSIREDEVSNFIETIYSKAGSPINLSKMMSDLINGITARTISKKWKSHEAFISLFQQLLEAMGSPKIVDAFPSSRLLYMIYKASSRIEKLHREIDRFLENIINKQRASKDVRKTGQQDEAEDLLDVLLSLQQGNLEFPLTTENVKAIILEIFGAGSETSSTLWEWTMSELLRNPKLMKQAQKEVRQVFSSTKSVDESGLHNLKFLKLMMKETLRLHPPAPLFVRQCNNTCKINGYVIEAKSTVMINAWAIGRDTNYWTEAEKFYPERFIDSSIDYKGIDFEFIPFGAGKRMCPGMLFGIASIELPLAQLLYHFDWKLPNGAALENMDMNEVSGRGTTRRKHSLNLIPIPYCPSPLSV